MNHKEKGCQDDILLEQAIRDYLLWMIDKRYSHRTWALHERLVNHFSDFIQRRVIVWENIFTFETMKAFQEECKLTHASMAVRDWPVIFMRNREFPGNCVSMPCCIWHIRLACDPRK